MSTVGMDILSSLARPVRLLSGVLDAGVGGGEDGGKVLSYVRKGNVVLN